MRTVKLCRNTPSPPPWRFFLFSSLKMRLPVFGEPVLLIRIGATTADKGPQFACCNQIIATAPWFMKRPSFYKNWQLLPVKGLLPVSPSSATPPPLMSGLLLSYHRLGGLLCQLSCAFVFLSLRRRRRRRTNINQFNPSSRKFSSSPSSPPLTGEWV